MNAGCEPNLSHVMFTHQADLPERCRLNGQAGSFAFRGVKFLNYLVADGKKVAGNDAFKAATVSAGQGRRSGRLEELALEGELILRTLPELRRSVRTTTRNPKRRVRRG